MILRDSVCNPVENTGTYQIHSHYVPSAVATGVPSWSVRGDDGCPAVLPAGVRHLEWDGSNEHGTRVGSGVYFYRLVAGDYEETRKMTLVK